MLAVLLSLFAFLAPAVPMPSAPMLLPEVMAAAPLGAEVLLVHVDGSVTLADPASLEVIPSVPNAFGFPRLGTVTSRTDGAGPHVYETTYLGQTGSHTIRTPCAGYATLQGCAERHGAAVAALQRVFPPR